MVTTEIKNGTPTGTDSLCTTRILRTKTAGRSIGFVTAKEFRKIEGEDPEILPAASDRLMDDEA